MNFEVRKYYKRRDGKKVKCISDCSLEPDRPYVFQVDTGGIYSVHTDGKYWNGGGLDHQDIIAPWVDPLDFDWSCLAAWHNWISQDEDGGWRARVEKPKKYINYWTDAHKATLIPTKYAPKNFTGDWKESLFERPKA